MRTLHCPARSPASFSKRQVYRKSTARTRGVVPLVDIRRTPVRYLHEVACRLPHNSVAYCAIGVNLAPREKVALDYRAYDGSGAAVGASTVRKRSWSYRSFRVTGAI